MVSGKGELCNLALLKLGEGRVTTVPGNTTKGLYLDMLFGPTLDNCLREEEDGWNFAITRQTLAESTDTNMTKYEYMYQLPSDPRFLMFLSLLDEDYLEDNSPHFIEGNYLYTDLPDASLKYIGRIAEEDYVLMDSSFVEWVAYCLAKELAFWLTNDIQMANRMELLADMALKSALFHNNKDKASAETVTTWDQVMHN